MNTHIFFLFYIYIYIYIYIYNMSKFSYILTFGTFLDVCISEQAQVKTKLKRYFRNFRKIWELLKKLLEVLIETAKNN